MKVIWRARRGRAHLTTLWYCVRSVFGHLWLEWLFEPRDLWVGVYWTHPDVAWEHAVDIHVCVLPMLPLKIGWRRASNDAVKTNFRRWLYEERYAWSCRIWGEDAVARKWFEQGVES